MVLHTFCTTCFVCCRVPLPPPQRARPVSGASQGDMAFTTIFTVDVFFRIIVLQGKFWRHSIFDPDVDRVIDQAHLVMWLTDLF